MLGHFYLGGRRRSSLTPQHRREAAYLKEFDYQKECPDSEISDAGSISPPFASEESGAELWRAYRTVAEEWSNFATKRIAKPADIFPVFHELFKKSETA